MDNHFSNDILYSTNHHHQQSLTPLLHSQSYPLPQINRPNSHTLPPLPTQRSAFGPANGLFGQTSRPSPQPSYSTSGDSYSQQAPQGYGRYQSSHTTYSQLQQYSVNHSYGAHQQNFDHYPLNQALDMGQGRLSELSPMPFGSMSQPSLLSTSQTPLQSLSTPITPLEPAGSIQPTHVVGSQGRRGILPSAEGRPAAVTNSGPSSTKSSTIPAKDTDGKFPCPHCNKTYLHAKHLKRHLLRHTGDRPYMCILCKDTFSRSDILKRHFQKCSIRRGNPTGATHLSYSHSHLRKTQNGAKKGPVSDQDSNKGVDPPQTLMSNGGNVFVNSNMMGLGISGFSDSYQTMSTPVSRSNSTKRYGNESGNRDRRSLNGLGSLAFPGGNYTLPSEHISSSSLSTSTASTPLEMNRQSDSGLYSQSGTPERIGSRPTSYLNGMGSAALNQRNLHYSQFVESPHTQGNPFDWAGAFQPEIRDSYINFPSTENDHPVIKSEPHAVESSFSPAAEAQLEAPLAKLFEGSFPTLDGTTEDFHIWNYDDSQIDAYISKSSQLIAFCSPGSLDMGGISSTEHDDLQHWLAPDNIRQFLDLYSNFQGHWPIIHVPTFNPFEVYEGLLLAMICIGAVYSDRMNLPQVRALVSHVKTGIERSSRFLHLPEDFRQNLDINDLEVQQGFEELKAVFMIEMLSIWHGDPIQRQNSRNEYGKVVSLARKLRMLQPVSMDSSSCSILHQPSPVYEQVSADHVCSTQWNWKTWLRQEKRSRLMFVIFLLDTARVIYFNCQPFLDPGEIQLPLPADDAAWEAKSANECAAALGLQGPQAQASNTTGSLRRKQHEMHLAMRALLHPTFEFPLRSTNAYSKFILVHALHVQIWNVQRQLTSNNALYGNFDLGYLRNGGNPPISHNDWMSRAEGSGRTSTSHSGQGTPTTGSSGTQSPGVHQLLKSTTNALQKWKKMWDEDMPLQYPPNWSKRVGWCRDGIHFYWLARLFLRTTRAAGWHASPDMRFMQVINSFKKVRAWVSSENASRGEEIGSIGDVDESYGVGDLTLDMKLLFTPIPQRS